MYEHYYHFAQLPFGSAPNADCWFPAEVIEQARSALTQCVELAAGTGFLVGPAGTGKSLLCARLAAQFCSTFKVVTLASARLCSRRALLQNILFELNRPYRGLAEGELRLDLIDHLRSTQDGSRGMLILADEAHALPFQLLEELRMITNLVSDGQPRVQLVLSGSARLEEKLADPRMQSLNQRIATRCYLESMGYGDACEYVRFQIDRVGGSADPLFPEDALSAIYHASDGIPRVMNQLCNHVLMSVARRGEHVVSGLEVERAWADLQQLPAPWNEQSASSDVPASDAGVIEFGPLEDEICGDPVTETHPPEAPAQAIGMENLSEIEHETAAVEWGAFGGLAQAGADGGSDPDSHAAPPEGPSENPFGEEFAEEEVVLDRYRTLAAELPTGQPGAMETAQTDAGTIATVSGPPVGNQSGSADPCPAGSERASLADDRNLMTLIITSDGADPDGRTAAAESPLHGDEQVEARKRHEVARLISDAEPLASPATGGMAEPNELFEVTGSDEMLVHGGAFPITDAYLVLHSDVRLPVQDEVRSCEPPLNSAPPESDTASARSPESQQAAFEQLMEAFRSDHRGRAAG